MLDLHGQWKAKKELAEKLYQAGIKKRHKDLERELKEEIERFKERVIVLGGRTAEGLKQLVSTAPDNMTGDEYVAQLKEQIKQKGANLQRLIKEESKFPVGFDDGLGKLLDNVVTEFKKNAPSEQREKTTDKTVVVIAKYRSYITEKKDELAKGDSDIGNLLKETLTEIESLVRNWKTQSAERVDGGVWEDCNSWIGKWEQAKKESQKAHKGLPKDALLYLKSEKYDGYPVKFNRGLGDALRAFKNITNSKSSLSQLKSEVGLAVNAYRSDIEEVQKKYKRLIPKFSAEAGEILEPLEKTLKGIESEIVNRGK